MQTDFDSDEELPTFDPATAGKKKKKSKPTTNDLLDGVLDIHAGNEHLTRDPVKKQETEPGWDQVETVPSENQINDLDFDFGKKKKKKKPVPQQPEIVNEPVLSQTDDGDYDYFELLHNVYVKLGRSDAETKSHKLDIPSIQLSSVGTTKTVWCNIKRIAVSIRRDPDHLQKYTVTELAVNSSINGEGQLVMKGRFQVKQIETVVRHYINSYVKCGNCNGMKTRLSKNDRMNFINCDDCHASKTVDAVGKNFYQAKTKYNKPKK